MGTSIQSSMVRFTRLLRITRLLSARYIQIRKTLLTGCKISTLVFTKNSHIGVLFKISVNECHCTQHINTRKNIIF